MGNVPDGHRLRIKLGEFDGGALRHTRAAAWTLYLQVAAEVEPEVMRSLMSPEMLALFVELRRDGRNASIDQQIEQHIVAWCDRWGFHHYYAHVPAQNTLADARPDIELPKNFTTDVHGWRPGRLNEMLGLPPDAEVLLEHRVRDQSGEYRVIEAGDPIDLELPTFRWELGRETRREAFERIARSFADLLNTAMDELEDSALQRGEQRVAEKRQPQHFVWLARFQIRRERVADIAEELWPDRDPEHRERTVRRGINAAAEDLGITRRRDKAGPRRRDPDISKEQS